MMATSSCVSHSFFLPNSVSTFLPGTTCFVPVTTSTIPCFRVKQNNNCVVPSVLGPRDGKQIISNRLTFQSRHYHPQQQNYSSKKRRITSLYQQRRRDQYEYDDTSTNDNILVTTVDQISKTISRPTPILGIPLGYPLTLFVATILLPLSTAVLLNASFGGYLYLGRQMTQIETYDEDDEDEEEEDNANNTINLVALAGAIASAGLLSPEGFGNVLTAESILEVVGTAGVGLAIAVLTQSLNSLPKITPDEKLMDSWDERFKEDMLDKK